MAHWFPRSSMSPCGGPRRRGGVGLPCRAALVLAAVLGTCVASALLRRLPPGRGWSGTPRTRGAWGWTPSEGAEEGRWRRLRDGGGEIDLTDILWGPGDNSTLATIFWDTEKEEAPPKLPLALLSCLGLLYMFVALYIVCDEFFVPALDAISAKLGLSADVAGATFMAAGGSAPEFFTSLIGALQPEPSDIGIAAIVGSAVFNVLAVIGACGLAATRPLKLTWYPLARDSLFYLLDLGILAWFFADGKIEPREASVLFLLYVAYCVFMVFSEKVERALTGKSAADDEAFAALDKDHDGTITREEAAASDEARRDFDAMDADHDGKISNDEFRQFRITSISTYFEGQEQKSSNNLNNNKNNNRGSNDTDNKNPSTDDETQPLIEDESTAMSCCSFARAPKAESRPSSATDEMPAEAPFVEDEAISLCPPPGATCCGLLWYVFTLPIVFVLYMTVPDVRRPGCWKRLYVPGFLLSITWIAAFSYGMIRCTEVVGDYTKIPTTILALTLLAWGTSVPDLLTSVLVTLQGHGDMAVSSSIGSNIFDITVGLPVPWIIFLALRGGSFPVGSDGLLTSIFLLIGMLAFTVGSILLNRWVLNKCLGAMMIVLWIGFTAYSIYVNL